MSSTRIRRMWGGVAERGGTAANVADASSRKRPERRKAQAFIEK
jgi:hypothetical protein